MRKKIRLACAAALGVGTAAFVSSRAEAAVDCSALIAADSAFPSASTAATVYIAGSTAVQVALEALAPVIATKNIAIVYQAPDSCQGVSDLLGHSAESGKPYLFLDPGTLFDAGANAGLASPITCTVPSAPPIDIAPSDVYPDTCARNLNIGTVGSITTTSTPVRDFFGPIQAMTFAVPAASTATSISAEAAYVVFGYDATTSIVPQWNVPGAIYTRPNTSGTLNMLATAIGLAPTKFQNATPSTTPPAQQAPGTSTMLSDIAGATTNANATIGQLSFEAIAGASNSSAFKILAYQHTGQTCGYLPGSDAQHIDMINVRQGRYAVWGPVHFLANVDSSGNPLNGSMTASPAVTQIMNYFLATGPTPPTSSSADAGVTATDIQTLIKAEAKPGYVVPWCAMQAQRTTEIGAPASYQPTTPCGCYYENVLGVHTSTYCHSCSADADCADSGTYTHCRYGFCEAN